MKIYKKVTTIFLINFLGLTALFTAMFMYRRANAGDDFLLMRKVLVEYLDRRGPAERRKFYGRMSRLRRVAITESTRKVPAKDGSKVEPSPIHANRYYIFKPAPAGFPGPPGGIKGGPPRGFGFRLLMIFAILFLALSVPVVITLIITLKPISGLAAVMERFGNGDTTIRAPENSGNHEIRLLTTTFNSMAARIAAAQERDKLLLKAVTHEMRTPVSSLRWGFEIIRERGELARLEELDSLIGNLESTLEDVDIITSNILRREEPAIMEFSLTNFLSEFEAEGRRLAHAKGKELTTDMSRIEAPGMVLGNPAYLSVILKNLVMNALVHGAEGDKVRLEILPSGSRPGIPIIRMPAHLPPDTRHESLFAPFYRGPGSALRDPGGKGLGLAIARALSRGMHWRLDYEEGAFVLEPITS